MFDYLDEILHNRTAGGLQLCAMSILIVWKLDKEHSNVHACILVHSFIYSFTHSLCVFPL